MMRCLAFGPSVSKKRQGTKSREVWRQPCRERYGDLIFAPAVLMGWHKATWMGARKGGWKSGKGISVVAWTASTGDRLVDGHDWAERDRRQRDRILASGCARPPQQGYPAWKASRSCS